MGAVNFSSEEAHECSETFYTSSHSTRRITQRADGRVIPATSLSRPILYHCGVGRLCFVVVNGNHGEMRNIAEYGMYILRINAQLPRKMSFRKKSLF